MSVSVASAHCDFPQVQLRADLLAVCAFNLGCAQLIGLALWRSSIPTIPNARVLIDASECRPRRRHLIDASSPRWNADTTVARTTAKSKFRTRLERPQAWAERGGGERRWRKVAADKLATVRGREGGCEEGGSSQDDCREPQERYAQRGEDCGDCSGLQGFARVGSHGFAWVRRGLKFRDTGGHLSHLADCYVIAV